MAKFPYGFMTNRLLLKFGITLSIIVGLAWNADTISAVALNIQSATATLNGAVVDEHDARVADVSIRVTNADTALQRQAITSRDGYFSIGLLPPGTYSVSAQHQGFTTAEVRNLKLNVGDQLAIKIQLRVGSISESMIIEGASMLQSESAAVGAVVDRQFVENLPLNGRSFHALIELTPGTVLTKSTYAEQGQFSVNGQRNNANYFMIDGVSANVGVGGGISLVQTAGGTVPAFTALGTTSNLVSVDALQEFRIQTSTYAPEFGRTPGAQVSLVTRAGTNQFHGTLFNYFRNDALDANDWFANSRGLKKPPLRQNDFGGVFGGPIIKNRTFFFFSYEGLRLRLPQVGISQVPSVSARKNAVPRMQPFLNAFPVPNGRDLAGNFSEFNASYSDPSNLDATSIRVDQTLGHGLTLFGRYNHAPSNSIFRDSGASLSNFGINDYQIQTLTVGLTQAISSAVTNGVRVNYSSTRAGLSFFLNQLGGAVAPPDSLVFPSFTSAKDAFFSFSLPGGAYLLGKNADNQQRQINVVEGLSALVGVHQLKFGIDYRRLAPILNASAYSQQVGFSDLGQAETGTAMFAFIDAGLGRLFPVFTNLSAYAQDTWKATRRLTLIYGLRWELNPPPKEKNANDPYTVIGLDDPATMTLALKGTRLWKTSYNNFAPRFGVAYALSRSKGLETVVRGGIGVFYDLGSGPAGRAIGSYPFIASKTLSDVAFPLTSEHAAPPAFTSGPPFANIFVFDPNLKLPRTYQFNFSIEQSLGSDQTISVSYVGAVGRDLLRMEVLRLANLPNPNFTRVVVGRNASTSDYHALQLKFQRRLSSGLQALGSYTLSHSIDSASTESAFNVPATKSDPNLNRGPSDFDVRHSFSGALTYDIPTRDLKMPIGLFLRDWSVDAILRARSATPVNVILSRPLVGIPQISRPDLVPGVPLYVHDPAVAGHRRFNRAAFSVPALNQQGNLGRNSLRGFSVSQMDLALRRKFNLAERVNLQFRGDFFNVFNHPNFADPNRSFNDINFFGQSLQTLGQSLNDGAGLSPLYQIGGPRSIQLALKLQF
jgi:hypothetical protein